MNQLELPFSYTYAVASYALIFIAAAGKYFGGIDMDAGYNLLPLIALAVAVDLTCRYVKSDLVRDIVPFVVYGIILVAITSISGLMASYATQRLAFPLQDKLLGSMDQAIGFDWLTLVMWVEDHPLFAQILFFAYNSMTVQIFATVIILAVLRRKQELRVYLASFSLSLLGTIVVAALLPAMNHLADLDTACFSNVRFSGGVDSVADLISLREDLYPRLRGGSGLLYFPSFHAVSAVLSFLALRNTILFVPNGVLTGLLMIGATTEGAHYACDVLSGTLLAVGCYAVATRLLELEGKLKRPSDLDNPRHHVADKRIDDVTWCCH